MHFNSKVLLFIVIIIVAMGEAYSACTRKFQVRLREGPGKKHQTIKLLERYTPLKIIAREGVWLKVQGHDFAGFIYSKLVSRTTKCVTVLYPQHDVCPGEKLARKKDFHYLENFQVIRSRVGCHYIRDTYGAKYWISSAGVWPKISDSRIQVYPAAPSTSVSTTASTPDDSE